MYVCTYNMQVQNLRVNPIYVQFLEARAIDIRFSLTTSVQFKPLADQPTLVQIKLLIFFSRKRNRQISRIEDFEEDCLKKMLQIYLCTPQNRKTRVKHSYRNICLKSPGSSIVIHMQRLKLRNLCIGTIRYCIVHGGTISSKNIYHLRRIYLVNIHFRK